MAWTDPSPVNKGDVLDAPKWNAEVVGNLDLLYSMIGSSLPVGVVLPYAGAAAPTDWLLCNGEEYRAVDYPALSALLGTTFGTAAAGRFRVPDLMGRVPVGAGAGTGLTARALGAKVGEEAHTLTAAEMPSHAHGGTTGMTAPNINVDGTQVGIAGGLLINGGGSSWAPAPATNLHVDAHVHGIAPEGGGLAHNNMPPSLALTYIIRAA